MRSTPLIVAAEGGYESTVRGLLGMVDIKPDSADSQGKMALIGHLQRKWDTRKLCPFY